MEDKIKKSGDRVIAVDIVKDDYFVGWFMNVSESFRDALDIKYTDRVVGSKLVQDANGKDVKRSISKKVLTKGFLYDFHAGDMIHTDNEKYTVQVISANPSVIPKKKIRHGSLCFSAYVNNQQVGVYETTQEKFVYFLMHGFLYDKEYNLINVFV